MKNNPNQFINQGLLAKEKWPEPLVILQKLGIQPTEKNSSGYWIIRCPFHKNGQESNPSLNLHSIGGHYRCHSCNASGKDIITFYQQITDKNFIEAAKELGLWKVGKHV